MKHEKSLKSAYIHAFIFTGCILLAMVILTLAGHAILQNIGRGRDYSLPEYVDVQLIRINGRARRGEKLNGAVKDIVIHYVANPMTTAQNNRDYFNNPDTTVSSHFVVGLQGEVILCVPLDEKSSASNDRNGDTISIEVCHEDESGKFNGKTYSALVKLTAWLCDEFHLTSHNVIRHYDITGKLCPLYFVENENEWIEFLDDVEAARSK